MFFKPHTWLYKLQDKIIEYPFSVLEQTCFLATILGNKKWKTKRTILLRVENEKVKLSIRVLVNEVVCACEPSKICFKLCSSKCMCFFFRVENDSRASGFINYSDTCSGRQRVWSRWIISFYTAPVRLKQVRPMAVCEIILATKI